MEKKENQEYLNKTGQTCTLSSKATEKKDNMKVKIVFRKLNLISYIFLSLAQLHIIHKLTDLLLILFFTDKKNIS